MNVQFIMTFVLCIISCNGDDCPAGCKCTKGDTKHYVSCDKQGWSTITAMTRTVTDLSLEGNKFKTIPKELASLKIHNIYLSGNQFTTMDKASHKNLLSMPLWVLDMSQNPWNCSCTPDMLEFVAWIQKVNKPVPSNAQSRVSWVAIADGYNTLCEAPGRLRGRRLDGLSKTDMCVS